MFTIIFTCDWNADVYEAFRIEADSELQAVTDAARRSNLHNIVCVTKEEGLLEYADHKIIPSSYNCSNIPVISLFGNGNIKFSTLEFPITDENKNRRGNFIKEDFILAIRDVLLRKRNGKKTPPDHILVNESYAEIEITDSYSGYDDNIEPFHVMKFK